MDWCCYPPLTRTWTWRRQRGGHRVNSSDTGQRGHPGWDVLSGAQHGCQRQRPTWVTLTEAGARAQEAGRLGVTDTEGWRAKWARGGRGSWTGMCGQGAARAVEGRAEGEAPPNKAAGQQHGPLPTRSPLGRSWGGSHTTVGRRAGRRRGGERWRLQHPQGFPAQGASLCWNVLPQTFPLRPPPPGLHTKAPSCDPALREHLPPCHLPSPCSLTRGPHRSLTPALSLLMSLLTAGPGVWRDLFCSPPSPRLPMQHSQGAHSSVSNGRMEQCCLSGAICERAL